MRVLAIGATGVLGRELVPLLLRRGHELTVMAPGRRLDDLPAPVEPWRASLLDEGIEQRLERTLGACETVLNLATAIPRDPRLPGAWEVNTRLRAEGTRRLARAAAAAGVGRLVQMSITMAYPDGGDDWLDESTPLDDDPRRSALVAPVSALERAIRALPSTATRWTILRAARFTGPGTIQDDHRRLLAQRRLAVAGDPCSFVSMVAVADVARAVVAAAESSAVAGTVLNISDEPVRHGAYLDRLAQIDGVHLPPRAPTDTQELPSQRVDSSLARRLLHWKPIIGIWPSPILV